MYSDKNKKITGDHGSVAEELLREIPELEQKCIAVDKAIKDGYFTQAEALAAYKVKEVDYLPYALKNDKKLQRAKKQDQFFGSLSVVMQVFDPSFNTFDAATQKVIIRLKKAFTKSATTSPAKKTLQKTT